MKSYVLCLFLISTMAIQAQNIDIRADVVNVTTSKSSNGYSFNVTLHSIETGCPQYADWWEVLDKQGKLIYRRILFHSHPSEQPFTRSGGNVSLSPNETVYVRAHMNRAGYTGDVFKGSIASGFQKIVKLIKFPKIIEKMPPQPDGCAF